ncbi:hypothetical protein [Streptomyces sp. NPDC002054]|uniref:hypothetical protein n=1 Tax=Streptomyces sp. NPDC002054 TaxID=3154663 RepID=UPI003327BB5D
MSSSNFDWLQAADRHTELIDPVISVRQLARLDLRRKRLTRFDHCLVYATHTGEYVVFQPPHRPRATSRYCAVYEVDTGLHPVQAELSLPSANDALEFQATVDMQWQVHDPVAFVRSGYRNVPRLLEGELERSARTIARKFEIVDSAAAETELLAASELWEPLGTTAGLRTTWTLRLRRNQEAIAHEARLQSIGHQAAENVLTEQRGIQVDAAADGRRDALLRLRAERTDLYEGFLDRGGVRAWAWYLSQHPEDTKEFMNHLREDQRNLVRAQLELVTKLFEEQTAENHELAEPRRYAVKALTDVLAQPLGSNPVPEEPRPPREESRWEKPPGYGRSPVEPDQG